MGRSGGTAAFYDAPEEGHWIESGEELPKSTHADNYLETLLKRRRSVRHYSRSPLPSDVLKRILLAGQGIISPGGQRTAPSAHALYPLRLYVLVRRVEEMGQGLYRYDAEAQELVELHEQVPAGALLSAAIGDDQWLEDAAAVMIVGAEREIAMQHFASQQPDGKRGARYMAFEAGAVTQNMYLAVTQAGVGGVVVMGFQDVAMKEALKLPTEIDPLALFCVGCIEK